MASSNIKKTNIQTIQTVDDELSKRFINLDPHGYFLINLDTSTREIVVEQFSNHIDEIGRAIDPETGEPLPCEGGRKRRPIKIFKGRTAKEVGIELTEKGSPTPLSRLDHALYLGRELQRAENCLVMGKPYVQD